MDNPRMNTQPENNLHTRLCKKYAAQNRIFSALFEVTHRCPCRCLHCYLLKTPKEELSLAEIRNLFDQMHAEGVIELALSGGEPFMREDFPAILEYSAARGFFSNILTTGLLIGKAEIKLLQKTGNRKIELSLLGASAMTHDGIMQYPGAFNKLLNTIKLLKQAGILIVLKSTIMQANWRELSAMAELADQFGVNFSASLALTTREDHNQSPQQLAVTSNEISNLDISLIDGALIPLDGKGTKANLICRAGSTIAGISPEGDIFPCIMMRKSIGNIRENSLDDIWHQHPAPLLEQMRTMHSRDVKECYQCDLQEFCPRCPGVAYMETGNLISPVKSACKIAAELKKFNK
jgi:radical SAM protein with 4Fe4S-binding SPASM domain